jgi:hypothetical protein
VSTVQLTTSAENILRKIRDPRRLLVAVEAELDVLNQLTVDHIKTTRLTGQGPFPAEQGKLGARTGRYRNSLRRSRAEVRPSGIFSSIGTNLRPYPFIHEFGAEFMRKGGQVALRTNADGSLLRTARNGARFAGRKHKRVRIVPFGEHKVKVPARAPLQHGIADKLPQYGPRLSTAIERFWAQPT